MLRNYIIIAWRVLSRNKTFSLINIFGLSVGMTACILIFLYLKHELSYELHWKDADRIVKINWEESKNGITDPWGTTAFETGPSLKENFPEVQEFARLLVQYNLPFSYNGKYYSEDDMYFVDTSFLKVFDFELRLGNPRTCLRDRKAIVISESMAKKYFGSDNPLGKILMFADQPLKVTGVLRENNLKPSHLEPNALLTIDYTNEWIREMAGDLLTVDTYTYLKLKHSRNIATFDKKLHEWMKKMIVPELKRQNVEYTIKLKTTPVKNVHFDLYYPDEFNKSNKSYIYMFALVALFILVIACFNYMNLTTARATARFKELGMRKVVGASRQQLFSQFMGETFIICLIALMLSILLLFIVIPAFNQVAEKNIVFTEAFREPLFWLATIFILLFVSFAGGIYPALYLTRLHPVNIFSKKSLIKERSGNSRFTIRQAMVVVQFSIAIIVIGSTFTVYRQLRLLKNTPLGFNKDQVLVLTTPEMDSTQVPGFNVFRNEVLAHSNIHNFTIVGQVVGPAGNMLFYLKNKGKNSQASLNINPVGHEYLNMMKIPLVLGRNFSRDRGDDKHGFIINEAAAKFLKLDDPLNAQLSFDDETYGQVIGVTKDFHYQSPHTKIAPLVLVLAEPGRTFGWVALVKLSTTDVSSNVDWVMGKWKELFPQLPVSHFFYDEQFDKQYRHDNTLFALFTTFAILAILISCLGLFGLVSFVAQKRTKEIGIRKVVGASAMNIVLLISRDFMMLVVIAIVIGSPVAYYFMHIWLQDFANRITMGIWLFVIPGVFTFLLSLLTVSSLALAAAHANPVKSIRNE
jgi:putative ABC transport system permease protein